MRATIATETAKLRQSMMDTRIVSASAAAEKRHHFEAIERSRCIDMNQQAERSSVARVEKPAAKGLANSSKRSLIMPVNVSSFDEKRRSGGVLERVDSDDI